MKQYIPVLLYGPSNGQYAVTLYAVVSESFWWLPACCFACEDGLTGDTYPVGPTCVCLRVTSRFSGTGPGRVAPQEQKKEPHRCSGF